MTISTKLKKVLFKLSNLYFPFNQLSPQRLQEIVNHIRIIELQAEEILQFRGSASEDYLYLLEGEVDLICDESIRSINPSEESQHSPIQLPPCPMRCSLIARSNCIISHASRDTLDNIIAWDYISRDRPQNQQAEKLKYIDIIRNTLVFQRLPVEYIHSAFSRMQPRLYKKGDSLNAEQNAPYQLILSGRAEVQRYQPLSQSYQRVLELGIGDIFGEQAEISCKTPDETLVMLEDCETLELNHADYQQLIQRPQVSTVQAEVARTMLDNGYQLLDVRFAEEYAEQRIPEARLIPLAELRNRLHELDKQYPYIIYCHSGPRSAIAALLLKQFNLEAHVLQGGIRDWPYETELSRNKSNIVSTVTKFH